MVYKKYQCWYFDSRGKPLSTPCHQGSNCRFLHPEDEGWPGLEPMEKHLTKPDEDTPRRSYSDSIQGSAIPQKSESSPPRRSERRSLVPQHDLFARQKLEGDDRMRGSRNHDSMRGRRGDRKKSAERDPRDFNTRSYDRRGRLSLTNRSTADCPGKSNSQKPHSGLEISGKDKGDFPSNAGRSPPEKQSPPGTVAKRALSDNVEEGASSSGLAVTSSLSSKNPLSTACGSKGRAKQAETLFRELARLLNQVTQGADAQVREDRKIKALTELSSNIGKISKITASAVFPTVAEVLLKQAQGKQRLEDDLNTTAGIWDEIVDLLVAELCDTIDSKLDQCLKKMCEQGERLQKRVVVNASPISKRRRGGDDLEGENENWLPLTNRDRDHKQATTISLPEQKRRRFDEVCPPSRSDSTASISKPSAGMPLGIQDILSQMKQKIDEQAQALQTLTQENNELKAGLQRRTRMSPTGSLSTPWSSSNTGARGQSPDRISNERYRT